MKVGSLFAGIGGLDLGLERAGMEVRWQVEIDGFCRQVLAKHWPDVKRYEDVRDVGEHNLESVDLICGGFPCQDISRAGNKEGIDGAESGLWGEMHRVIRQLRPRYVFVENVSALLVRGLGRVLGDLAEIGYDAEWDCIPAYAVGAPHVRDRAFIVAYPVLPREAGRWPSRTGRGRSGEGQTGRDGWRGVAKEDVQLWAEPGVGRVADGVPGAVDRINALGNAVVPQVAEFIGRRILVAHEAMTADEDAA